MLAGRLAAFVDGGVRRHAEVERHAVETLTNYVA
jgi:hypothetical protein